MIYPRLGCSHKNAHLEPGNRLNGLNKTRLDDGSRDSLVMVTKAESKNSLFTEVRDSKVQMPNILNAPR